MIEGLSPKAELFESVLIVGYYCQNNIIKKFNYYTSINKRALTLFEVHYCSVQFYPLNSLVLFLDNVHPDLGDYNMVGVVVVDMVERAVLHIHNIQRMVHHNPAKFIFICTNNNKFKHNFGKYYKKIIIFSVVGGR